VVKIWRYFVVGDFLKIVKTRVFVDCFKDMREKLVSLRGFLIGRRLFRGAFGALEAANDPGWQNARRGIHRRWYKEEKKVAEEASSLARGLRRGVAGENGEGGYREKKKGGGS
jgi:hypothetical protein